MSTFGESLLELRNRSSDPYHPNRKLSQERFGQLLGEEMADHGFSGTAVHYWENGKSQIHKDDRIVLITILKVLYKNGGLKTIAEAESLLIYGNYRALDENEKQQIFPKNLLTSPILSEIRNQIIPVEPLAGNASSRFDFQEIVTKASNGPPPAWPRITAAVLRKASDHVEAANPVRLLIWLPVWILAYNLLSPSLQWPYFNYKIAEDSIYFYMAATFILPLLIGLFTNTEKNPVWNSREKASPLTIRAYTYQGAFVGFHIGYFALFILHLIAYYLQTTPAIWMQFILASLPLFMGSIGAHVVPDNLWRAYQRLSLADGWIFFVSILIGPFWTWLFLEFHELILSRTQGVIIVLTALIVATWWSGHKFKNKKV